MSAIGRVGAGPAKRCGCASLAPHNAAIRQHRRADAGSDRKQNGVLRLARGSAGGLGKQGEMGIIAQCQVDIGKQRGEIDAVEVRQVRYPRADGSACQAWNRHSQLRRLMLAEQRFDPVAKFLECRRRLPMVDRGGFGRIADYEARAHIGSAEIDRKHPHPFTPELTMLSTKKRCRKTKSTSGGSTASVAPAITSPVFIAPRL